MRPRSIIPILLITALIMGCSLVPTSTDEQVRARLEKASDVQLEKIINVAKFAAGESKKTKMRLVRSRVLVGNAVAPLMKVYPTAKEIYFSRQRAWLKTLPDGRMKSALEGLLDYKLKPGERFDEFGDIMKKLPDDQEVALLGYSSMKRDLFEPVTKATKVSAKRNGAPKTRVRILRPTRIEPRAAVSLKPSLPGIQKTIPGREGEPCFYDSDCMSGDCMDALGNVFTIPDEGDGETTAPAETDDTLSLRAKVCGASCDDGIKDGNETDVDCGGPCRKCPASRSCAKSSDCRSGICSEGICLSVPPGEEDGLHAINDRFYKGDYKGLMRYADILYERGVFPLLPYLTEVKNQGNRGTCCFFSKAGAAEIILRNRPDLSEQFLYYQGVYLHRPALQTGKPTGLEREWPYNRGKCEEGRSYYSPLLEQAISCSYTEHQGIASEAIDEDFIPEEGGFDGAIGGLLEDDPDVEQYLPYWGARHATEARCVINVAVYSDDTNNLSSVTSMADLGAIINESSLPLQMGTRVGNGVTQDGFAGDDFFADDGGGHAMLIVAYIPAKLIPFEARQHPHLRAGEAYFIVKNSWGWWRHDGGFLYVPESVMLEHLDAALKYIWDSGSEIYADCPPSPIIVSPIEHIKPHPPARKLHVR